MELSAVPDRAVHNRVVLVSGLQLLQHEMANMAALKKTLLGLFLLSALAIFIAKNVTIHVTYASYSPKPTGATSSVEGETGDKPERREGHTSSDRELENVEYLVPKLPSGSVAVGGAEHSVSSGGNDDIDEEWLRKRKELLSDPNRPKKVLLVTYMRGGSSFLGELFAKNPDAIYWYEVAASFFADRFGASGFALPLHISQRSDGQKREVLPEEKKAVSKFVGDLFNCEVTSLPVSTLTHNFMRAGHRTGRFLTCLGKNAKVGQNCNNRLREQCSRETSNDCFRNISLAKSCPSGRGGPSCKDPGIQPFIQREECYGLQKPNFERCLPTLKPSCDGAHIRSAKVHRFTMESLETLIQEMPDVYIIYYSRDPRGTLASRLTSGRAPHHFLWKHNKGNPVTEANIFCPKMLRDLTSVKQYEARYPGAVKRLAYEDLAAHPMEKLEEVYSYIGEKVPDSVRTFMAKATSSGKGSKNPFGTRRTNSTATANKWKKRLSPERQEGINSACIEVYKDANYPL